MKKIVKVLLLSFLVVFVTGCMDFNAEMEIRKDKSMTFSIAELVDEDLNSDDLPYFSDNDVKRYRESGFTTSKYIVDDRVGHILTKDFTNIDDVSSKDQLASVDATKALLENGEYIFTVKKGIFKNRYYATFNVKDFIDYLNVDEDKVKDATLEFSLVLPYKVIASNATNVSKNGRNLEWNLSNLNDNQIYFEFKLYNLTNVYIVLGGIAVIGLLTFSEYRDKKIAKSFYNKK